MGRKERPEGEQGLRDDRSSGICQEDWNLGGKRN